MKRPSQKISFVIPESHELRDRAIHSSTNCNEYLERHVPECLLPIASQIVELEQKLRSLCDSFDLARLQEKQKLIQLNREETDELYRLERERKIAKETDRMKKKEISSLRGNDKRFAKQTGMTPKDYIAQMIAEFKRVQEQKSSEKE